MIFTLVSLLSVSSPARAHLNLGQGSYLVRGKLERTEVHGHLAHDDILIDLSDFGDKTESVCNLLLGASDAKFLKVLDPTPDPVIDVPSFRRASPPKRYGEVEFYRQNVHWRLSSDPRTADRLTIMRVTKDIGPTEMFRLRGKPAWNISSLVRVANQMEFRDGNDARSAVAHGTFHADGTVEVTDVSVPVDLGRSTQTFVSIYTGLVSMVKDRYVLTTAHGRSVRLVAGPTSAVELNRELLKITSGEQPHPPEATLMGVEANGVLEVYMSL